MAVREILRRPDLWSMDCATFVQVVQLNALLKTLGPGEFNRFMNERKSALNGRVILGQHYSSGLEPRYGYERDEAGAVTFVPNNAPQAPSPLGTNDHARMAPIGSEVVFSNPHAQSDSPYRYENAIKIGEDQYVAFPVGDPVVSGRSIRQQLAAMAPPPDRDAAGRLLRGRPERDIQISSVAVFEFLP